MLIISFYPEYDREDFIISANEYQQIWNSEGDKIIKTIERISRLNFVEKQINAIISNFPAYSAPLRFRFNIPYETKKASITHELCHRLLVGNKIKLKKFENPVDQLRETHKVVNLILFDILVELYGESFTKKHIELESAYSTGYKDAWDWLLHLSKDQRSMKFKSIIEGKINLE